MGWLNKTQLNNPRQQLRREIEALKDETISENLKGFTNNSSTDYSLWVNKSIKRFIMLSGVPRLGKQMDNRPEIMNKHTR